MNLFRRFLQSVWRQPMSPVADETNTQAIQEENREAPHKLARRFLDLCPLTADDWLEHEDLLQELVRRGKSAAPAIESALDAGLRSAQGGFEYENMGLLCEAFGKVGGSRAMDVLSAIAVAPSNIAEYRYLREGAIRGLGHVDAPGVVSLLKRLKQQMPSLSHVIVPSLRQHGIEVENHDIDDSRWYAGAATWEEIAEAFVNFEIEKTKPDYASLREKTSPLSSEQKHGVWRSVGDALRERGDSRTATQCYVEALAADSSSAYTTWMFLEIPLAIPEADRVRREIEEVRQRAFEDHPERNRRIVSELRAALGLPGEDPASTAPRGQVATQ